MATSRTLSTLLANATNRSMRRNPLQQDSYGGTAPGATPIDQDTWILGQSRMGSYRKPGFIQGDAANPGTLPPRPPVSNNQSTQDMANAAAARIAQYGTGYGGPRTPNLQDQANAAAARIAGYGGGSTTTVDTPPPTTPDPSLGGSHAYDGFAGFVPPEGWDNIMGDPDMLAYEWLKYMNQGNGDPTAAMADRFSKLADMAPMIKMLLDPTMNVNNDTGESDQEMLNWISNYLHNQATAGGSVPAIDVMLNQLVQAGAMTPEEFTAQNNSLGELLNAGTDQGQIEQYAAYAAAATQGLNPQAQAAVLMRLERWAREWMSNRLHDSDNYKETFGQFVQAKGGLFGAR